MKNIIKLIFLALALASCGDQDYPPFTYTNNSGRKISFQTGEERSPEYEIEAGSVKRLDSNVRGRGDIITVEPPYVIREREGHDGYDIVFVVNGALPKVNVQIENYLTRDIVVTEEGGYLYPRYCEIEEKSSGGNTADQTREEVTIYTKEPVFKLVEADPEDPEKWVDFSGSANISFYIDTAGDTETMFVTVR
jgi:hypothetical protein